jgi:hypothetical protein
LDATQVRDMQNQDPMYGIALGASRHVVGTLDKRSSRACLVSKVLLKIVLLIGKVLLIVVLLGYGRGGYL